MIIPIITSLKSALEKNKIPALRELMLYLRVRRPRAVWLPPAPQPPLNILYLSVSVWLLTN